MTLSEKSRTSIIDYLIVRKYPFHGKLNIISFLKRIWDLSWLPSTDRRFDNAEGDIWQHMVANEDWTYQYLLCDYQPLNLLKCEDSMFIKFLETCVHPIVLNEPEIDETVNVFNQILSSEGYSLKNDSHIAGISLYKVISLSSGKTPSEMDSYEVVLSFAGEDRVYVEKVADYLKTRNVKLFYDKYEETTLWGKDLYVHLDKVYRGNARYCVLFISKYYAENVWTNHERISAQAKALKERQEYILPARFDKTEIEGILPTVGYVDLTTKTPEQLGQMIMQKLGKNL
ncbi:MAG: TIR domain-containing protein [Candidatus Micrarchaeota archaeon]|nr:TIR domain-containing protein [Candidatus Micrarchaeota archaeon]